jgi:phosphate transport system permease protein
MATSTEQPETEQDETIARPPTEGEVRVDRFFQSTTRVLAWLTISVVVLVVALIGRQALPAINRYGSQFIVSSTWDAGKSQYGILPEIFGTMLSSVIGVTIGAVFGVMVAIFLTQEFIPRWLADVFRNIVSLLAAIPSVVYGLWGIFVVIPAIRPACNWLHHHWGWIPAFSTPLLSVGMLPAALVLAIMILPTVSAISRDAIAAVDPLLAEASFGLGATRWETILHVILPMARRGIYGSVVLGFGRAIGETMALAMLVGSSNVISPSIFSPASTLAALLANKFPEAASPLDIGVLMYAALVLLGLTLLVNVAGDFIMRYEFRAAPALAQKETPP